MGQLVDRMWCSECDGFRRTTAWTANSLLHLSIIVILALLSKFVFEPIALFAILWPGIWLFDAATPDWRCSQCGTKSKARQTLKLRRAKRASDAEAKRGEKLSHELQANPDFTPPRPSVLHETARAEWDAKYGKRS